MGFQIENGVLEKYTKEPGVTEVVIPDSVTEIGDHAFENCESIASITIPDDVTSIGESAFSGCSRLIKVTIGNSVTSIGKSAFSGCSRLTKVTIGNSVTEIGYSAFSGCKSLACITIPDSVTEIGDEAFSGTPWLENYPNDLVIVGKGILYKYKGTDTNVIIPDSVTSIGEAAFRWCESLASITIPDSVTEIGDHAFENCISLTSVTIPDSVKKIGGGAFYGCESLASITIPDSVTQIGSGAFDCCTSLASITIPDSVTEIGNGAFDGCTSLASITIPDSVKKIGRSAFSGCKSLESIDVKKGNLKYSSIDGILYDSSGKKLILCPQGRKAAVIPDSVKKIDNEAFSGCESLKKLTIFGCTVDNTRWNWDKVQIPDVRSMLDKKEYNVTMDHPTKYMFVTQVFLNTAQPEAEAYIKKNALKIIKWLIDADDYKTVKGLFESGKFVTKRNIMKFVDHSIEHTQNGGDMQIQAYIMDYKNKHFPDTDPLKNVKL